jgi:uncharacterized protein YecE (DUF72 family)
MLDPMPGPQQDALFPSDGSPDDAPVPNGPDDGAPAPTPRSAQVEPAPVPAGHQQLAQRLSPRIHFGTSSWSYPGWDGMVWDGEYSERSLSRHGLTAYACHPLLRAVGIDRSFYRPLTATEYAAHAAQVPADFRFVVKCPALVTDAMARDGDGRRAGANPHFLDPEMAWDVFVQPALDGLGGRIGALVFEISPLPPALKADVPALLQRLDRLLHALPPLPPTAPDGVLAVEVRDPDWLTPDFARVLKANGARYCLGLHPRLPPIDAQLPLLRALWPGALVGRWTLHRRHGPRGYERAEQLYQPYRQLMDPDLPTRQALARVIRATAAAGWPVHLTVSNKAEGSAPLSVFALAEAVAEDLAEKVADPPAAG